MGRDRGQVLLPRLNTQAFENVDGDEWMGKSSEGAEWKEACLARFTLAGSDWVKIENK